MAIESLTGNAAGIWVDVSAARDGSDLRLVALQRGLTNEDTREIIDASHKGSDFQKSVYGRRSGTLSFDGLRPDPDFGGAAATHDALRTAMDNKYEIIVEVRETGAAGTVIRYAASALIGTLSSEWPDNDVSTFSCELTLQGPLTRVP